MIAGLGKKRLFFGVAGVILCIFYPIIFAAFLPHAKLLSIQMNDVVLEWSQRNWVPVYSDILIKSYCKIMQTENQIHTVKVTDNLYIGTWCGATNLELLESLNITRVVNTCGRCFQRFGNKKGEDFLHLILEDVPSQKISQHFNEVIAFIEKAIKEQRNVLVHCAQGRSRSASFILAYLIKKKNLSLPESLRLLKDLKPDVEPNEGFMQQLQLFEMHQ